MSARSGVAPVVDVPMAAGGGLIAGVVAVILIGYASWVYVLAQRPSFTGGGTDSAAYGWFVWDDLRHPSRREWATRMQVLSWR